MEPNFDNKIDFKSRLTIFYKENKIKTLMFFFGILILLVSIILVEAFNKKKNIQISEEFIKAGILYTGDEISKSKKIYENILKSNNSFYSILALNNIIEKGLEKNNAKVLEYFDIVEKSQKKKEQKDILNFKKALYLLKYQNNQDAKILLNELVDSDSEIKNLAEDILVD